MAKELWTEKHRPATMDEYVWRDPSTREKVEEWIADGALPHILLSGAPGTGKTSLAYLLMKELDIPSDDILFVPSSRIRKVEEFTDRIMGFISAWTLNKSGVKYIILDEADKLSRYSQDFLRTETEVYSQATRFIMTCNHPHLIQPALHSRFQELKFSALDKDSFVLRAADVLYSEEVRFEPEDLMLYVDMAYPDLRKCIGMLSQNSRAGVLYPPKADDEVAKDYLIESVDLFKKGKFLEARKMIVTQADPDEYDAIYRWLYQNLDLFGKTPDQQDDALIIIKDGLVNDGRVGDKEINLAATLAALTQLSRNR